jgi:hypothetical protein
VTSSQPPSWAQSLIALFVPARGRDGVLGDLLEEYHETQLPARGVRRANLWYVRQVFGFAWRWSLPWGLLVSAVFVARDSIDLSMPTADFHMRAAVTSYVSIFVFALGGFSAAWRSHRALSGTALGAIAALITCAVTTLYALTVGAVLLNAAFSANPELYRALVETNDVPIVPILLLGVIAGSIGGAIGRLFTGRSGSRAAARM